MGKHANHNLPFIVATRQTDPRFGPIPVTRGPPRLPLGQSEHFVSSAQISGTAEQAPATHPELKPLACSQARTSEALERGLSCGSGARGPGAVRLGPERPWARRACSSSLTLSIWQNFSASGKETPREDGLREKGPCDGPESTYSF